MYAGPRAHCSWTIRRAWSARHRAVADADLLMLYIEQPDGSGHQFLLDGPAPAEDFTNPASIGAGQDAAKVARYASLSSRRRTRPRTAPSSASSRRWAPTPPVAEEQHHRGLRPRLRDLPHRGQHDGFLASPGLRSRQGAGRSPRGPAVNVYINLQGGAERDGLPLEYLASCRSTSPAPLAPWSTRSELHERGRERPRVRQDLPARPSRPNIDRSSFGRGTSEFIGQDSGTFRPPRGRLQLRRHPEPVVQRLGDARSTTPVLSLPNFYGAHGYDPLLPNMSAIFIAAGPGHPARQPDPGRAVSTSRSDHRASCSASETARLVDGSAPPVRHSAVRAGVRAVSTACSRLLPTGDKKSRRPDRQAVRSLELALDARSADDAHPDWSGTRVFQEARNVVSALSTTNGLVERGEALDGTARRGRGAVGASRSTEAVPPREAMP